MIQIGRYKLSLATILFIIPLTALFSQKDALKKANELYQEERFHESLIYLNRVAKVDQSGPLLFKRAIINYNINQLQHVEQDFNQAVQLGFNNSEIDYYLGVIHHDRGRFITASEYYKMYLKSLKKDDPKKSEIYHRISQCGHAQTIKYQSPLAIIEKLPKPVNSAYDDFGWLSSPNDSVTYYFTTNRPNTVINLSRGHHEIYSIKDQSGEWSKPKRLSYPINTRNDEVMIGFNDYTDGIYLLRKNNTQSEILMHQRGDTKGKQDKINIPTNLNIDNAQVFFYNDHFAIFSAELSDGFGGYDLYFSVKEGDVWTQPENMGSSVNSAYDELEPTLTHDGQNLYFTSNRPESIGGYDIYRCNYLYESEAWSTPYNLGIPVNSPGNEKGLRLNDDGLTAYFSSDRKSSFGGYDIYFARFKEKQLGQHYYASFVPFSDYMPADDLMANQMDMAIQSPVESIERDLIKNYEDIKYHIGSIYHLSEDYMDPAANTDQISRAREILLTHDDISLELISSGNDDDIIEYSLFASMKRAEKIKSQILSGTAIDQERINITGIGHNYPSVKKLSANSDKYNTRIDLQFRHLPDHISIVNVTEERIPENHKDSRYELYRTIIESDVSYKIEIAKVNQMYRGMALSLFNDATIEKDNATGLYSYTIGLYDNYAESIITQRNLERDGVVEAKVIPYVDGQRISDDQLIYYVNEYSSLKDYMNYDRMIGAN